MQEKILTLGTKAMLRRSLIPWDNRHNCNVYLVTEMDDNTIGFCIVCKDAVLLDDEFVIKNDEAYHKFCLNQIKDYRDNFDYAEETE